MTQNYTEGYEYLSSQFPEVSGCDFYREMFPNNERSDEQHMVFHVILPLVSAAFHKPYRPERAVLGRARNVQQTK